MRTLLLFAALQIEEKYGPIYSLPYSSLRPRNEYGWAWTLENYCNGDLMQDQI